MGFPHRRRRRRRRPLADMGRRLTDSHGGRACQGAPVPLERVTTLVSVRPRLARLVASRVTGAVRVCWSTEGLSVGDDACHDETSDPVTPPSASRQRVVHHAALQTAVSCVTVTTLWLAVLRGVGPPVPTWSRELPTALCLGSCCLSRAPHGILRAGFLLSTHSLYELLGAP
jgi:hypothetical protein